MTILAAALLAVGATAQEERSASEIEAFIRDLGSQDLEVRDAAAAALLKKGRAARKALLAAAVQNDDAEVAGRARDILDQLERSPKAIREFFARVFQEEKNSYQRLLWRAHDWANRVFKGKEWPEIWKFLREKGYRESLVHTYQKTNVDYHIRIADELPIPPGNMKHQFDLVFQVEWKPSSDARSKATIRRVSPTLLIRPGMKFEDFAAKSPYVAGTALALALEDSNARGAIFSTPELEEINLSYRALFNRWSGESRYRFYGYLEFVNDFRLPRKSARVNIDAISLLDPVRNFSGEVIEPGHVPKDALGRVEIRQSGSSAWGFDHGIVSIERPPSRIPVSYMGRSARISSWAYSPDDLSALPADTERIELRGEGLAGKLNRFTNLRYLKTVHLDDKDLAAIGRLPALEELWGSISGGTDRGVEAISKAPNLKKIGFYSASQITDVGMKRLTALKGLTYLRLYQAHKITPVGIGHLRGLPALEGLSLSGPKIDGEGWKAIAVLPTLRRLKVWNLRNLTPDDLAPLAEQPTLREVEFTYCGVNDALCGALGKISTLEYIEIYTPKGEGKLTDAGVLSLRGLRSLRALYLNKTEATEEGMKKLSALLPGEFITY